MLNRRQRHILKDLIQLEDYITVHGLAGKYQVSERSIRYDLDAIDYDIKQEGLKLERHKLLGVRLLVPVEDRKKWLDRLAGEPDYSNRLSAEERRDTILGVLFRKRDPVNSNALAELLYVSRRTVVDDLKRVEEWLKQRRLTLEYVQNKGFRITGMERDVRLAMADLASKQPHYLADISLKMTGLSDNELSVVRDVVTEQVQALPYELTDSALDGLIFHIAVALQRLRDGHSITMPKRELTELKEAQEFAVALSIGKAIASKLEMSIPEAEAGYVTLHLLGAKMLHERKAETLPVSEPLEEAVEHFIRDTGARLGTDLSLDNQLRQGLMVHLRPTLYRLKYNLRLENPFKQEIMNQYSEIVEAVNRSVRILEEAFHVSFNDDERAYLALHVGAAFERQAVTENKPRVLLVCGSGIGTAQLLSSRIRRYFPDLDIVDTRPLYQVTEEWVNQENVDWIISTIPICNMPIPHIVVNPFLTFRDRQQIASLIQRECENTVEERMTGPVLEEVLVPELIRLDVEVKDWEEAVRQAGQLLLDQNKVESSYVDAMVRMVKENGPYIVIDKGVAMPHARPEDGVKSLGFSLLRLNTPVNFGHDKNDPVKLVVCLSSVDAEMHLNALRQLAGILSDKENKDVLLTSDKLTILEKIHEASRS